jgi:hypothetical protein
MPRQIFYILFFFLPFNRALAGDEMLVNYRNIFRSDYTWALNLLSENQKIINSTCDKYAIDSHFFNAIIFPELIRYSILQDFFETQALKLIYVDQGREGADFSIGYFQMKPSFIEDLENYVKTDQNLQTKYREILQFNSNDLKNIREERVDRLQSAGWQAMYLCCFIDIVSKIYENNPFSTLPEKLNFYSSAYNSGFLSGQENIVKRIHFQSFPYGTQYKGKQYAYSDVSLFYYNDEILKTKN